MFQTESEIQRWKPVLVMLTEKDLLLFDSMPRMREHWLSPTHTYPLLATRYTLTHSVTAVFLLVHTNTPLENQSWYTHLQNSLYTHTHMQTLTLFAWQLAVLINWELKYSLSQPVGKKQHKSITAIKGLLKLYEAAAIATRDRFEVQV